MNALTPLSALSEAELDRRIGYAEVYGEHDRLTVLLAEQARRAEAADPVLKAKRLRQTADNLWERGEVLNAEAAQFYGKSAFRTRNAMVLPEGVMREAELQLGADFERRGDALTREANQLQHDSLIANCDAAVIEWRIEQAALLSEIVA